MMDSKENKKGISSFLVEDKYRVHRHLTLQVVILAISVSVFFDTPDRLNVSLNRFYGWISYFLFLNMLLYFNVYVLFPRLLAKNKMFTYIISVVLFTIFALFIMVILQELFYDIAVTHSQPSGMVIFLNIISSMCAIFLFLGGISTLLLFKQWMINNANIMVDEDPRMASHILEKLDDMLQYQFNDSTQNHVLLKADIAFLSDFLDLEKVRRDYFEYTVAVEGNIIEDVEVPPLLFIPFVENAVKHNMDTNKSYVYLKFRMESGCLFFECENSKPLKPIKQDAGGLGLANIKRRLDLLFKNNYVLDVVETETTYTVKLHLNL